MLIRKKIQNQITQRQINLADVSYLDLDSINNIIADFENPSQNSNKIEKSVKKTDGNGGGHCKNVYAGVPAGGCSGGYEQFAKDMSRSGMDHNGSVHCEFLNAVA